MQDQNGTRPAGRPCYENASGWFKFAAMNASSDSAVAERPKTLSPREDHRVRVAREKRERMKARILQSVLSVCSGAASSGPAVIDDVIRHAEVSRGTFYKYYNSLDEAVADLGSVLADEMTIGIYPVYNVLENPPQRTATGFQFFLLRALIDPAWGAFISHIGRLSSDSLLLSHVTADLRLGIKTGDFRITSIEAAADLVVGAQTEAIRRTLGGGHGGAYVRAMAGMVLRSLGVAPAKADRFVIQAYDRLCAEAPGSISWWKPTGRD